MTIERRFRGGEARAAADDEGRRLQGYAAVFNSPTNIAGLFREQVAPGAFAGAIDRDDVRALIDHQVSPVLGRTTAGTLSLREDGIGLAVDIDPPDTQFARDLRVSVERGDVNQMSFAFFVRAEVWEEVEGELPLRTIQDVALVDVSVVTFAAYEDTSVAVRSLEHARAQHRPQIASAPRARARATGSLVEARLRAGPRLSINRER